MTNEQSPLLLASATICQSVLEPRLVGVMSGASVELERTSCKQLWPSMLLEEETPFCFNWDGPVNLRRPDGMCCSPSLAQASLSLSPGCSDTYEHQKEALSNPTCRACCSSSNVSGDVSAVETEFENH